jgi:hypothetical protein
MKRGNDGLMHVSPEAHNALQITILEWMRKHVPEAERLPAYGNGTPSEVSCRAATAAAESVAHSVELMGLFD